MKKYISIDPGKCKCGLVIADLDQKKVYEALVIDSDLLVKKIKNIKSKNENITVILGNGTTSKKHANNLQFLGKDLKIVEERNTTFRAKKRYFEIFPISGIKRFLPKEIFIYNLNLDAISALIILEDHINIKFEFDVQINSKTWMKQ